jgi:CHAT domain-containing protein
MSAPSASSARFCTNALVCVAWLAAPALHAQDRPDVRTLTPGSVFSQEERKGEEHRYSVDLRAGDFLELSLSQQQAAANMAILGPNEAQVRKIAMIELAPLDTHLLFIASESGRYRVDVRLHDHSAAMDRYTLRVVALRAATDSDRSRDRCFAMLADGDRLAHSQSLEPFNQAFEPLQQAASCWREHGDTVLEIATLTSLGALTSMFSQFSAESAAIYERLAQIYAAAGDTEHELASLAHVVREHEDDGRFDRARTRARQMRELAVRVGDRRQEGYAVSHIAFTELTLGNYLRAREAATSAHDIGIQTEAESVQAFALVSLAQLDELAGDDDAARARYDRVLQLNPGGRYNRSLLPIELGFLHLRRGEYDLAAARFNERLAAAPTNVQRDQEALARIGLGDVLLARGDRVGGRALYEQASAALARGNTRHRCVGLERLGRLNLEDGHLDEAAAAFNQMLVLADRMSYPLCEAQGRAGLAALDARRGDFVAANIEARRVVELTETFREAVPSIESRALGFSAHAPAFEQAVDISMRLAAQGDSRAAAQALELNERALARGLLDRISRAAIDDRAQIPEALAQERQRVRDEWRTRLAQLQVVASFEPDARSRSEALRRDIASLEVQLHDLDSRVDATDVRRSRFVSPQPLDLTRIQSLLDPDTLLIEYALGARQSYVWVVSSTSLHGLPLAPRATIEAAVRLVREDLTTAPDGLQPTARTHRRALADLILAPAASLLKARRLIIVATGALSLVPFGALPVPGSRPVASMVSQFEIVHAPSATTLAALRTLSEHRSAATKTAIVLADPIFERSDPRVLKRSTMVSQQSRNRARSDAPWSRDSAAQTAAPLGQIFRRLPFSRDEADAITAMLPGAVTTIMNGEATRDRVLGNALADYRVVHFATHGIVHPEITSLSSIVLSLVDDHGAAHDPFVTLSDIYEMRLNADVVVLSACSSAVGKNVPGEGPIGLARAFMYAGAPRVVASLWEVSDRATAELMKRFYQSMLIDGLSAAAALRTAQLQLSAIPKWKSPYYWAGFTLQGDWR